MSSSPPSSLRLTVKWGKKSVDVESFVPAAGVKPFKQELEELTGVPADRCKLLSKSLWKGILKDDFDLTTIDWNAYKEKPVPIMLMGSATKLVAPKTKTVFLEDLPPEQAAAVQEPSGLVNLGNTCYLNSVVQCLRGIPYLRMALNRYTPSHNTNIGTNNSANALLVHSLKDTLNRLDRQTDALQPMALVQATRAVFPQFAQRGPQGQPQQQDAEEFFSGVLTAASTELVDTSAVTSDKNQLLGASNCIDALFGMKIQETLTCDESEAEPPVVSYDLHRKLVCNIQGGYGAPKDTNVTHVMEGLKLGLQGKIEKNSAVLGRNAMWTRTSALARLPPVLVVQFGRFYWKATPDSQDHAGVKCKIMKPVAFGDTLDVYEFCTPEIQKILKVSRDKALQEEEDRINQKLKGQQNGNLKSDDAMDTEETPKDNAANSKEDENKNDAEPMDEELQAALAMSMQEELAPVGPGLPANFQGIYELISVVVHKGRDADGGHYLAFCISDHQGNAQKIADTDITNADWFVYDDDEVSPCKTEDVLKLKGGGDWPMAYLSFYRAKK